MNKKKQILLIFLCSVLCVIAVVSGALLLNLRFMPMDIQGLAGKASIENPAQNRELNNRLNKIYDVNFLFDTASTRTAKILIPQYQMIEGDKVSFYSSLFGFKTAYTEKEDYYLFEDAKSQLKVYKYLSFLQYTAQPSSNEAQVKADPKTVIENAEAFLTKTALQIDHVNTAISFDGEKYHVSFVDRLMEYENYAFPVKITLDQTGQVEALDYYYFSYDKIDTVDVKTMKEAYYELPVDFEEDTEIDLKTCKLVYMFKDSIIQPAYLFEGEITQGAASKLGTTFQCFVKAAIYRQ